MILLDAFIRMSAVTLLFMTAFFSLRDARHLLQGKLAAMVSISLAAMLIMTVPDYYQIPFGLEAAAWVIHIPNTVFLWWFGLSLFQDDFRLSALHISALSATIIVALIIQAGLLLDLGWPLYVAIGANRALGLAMTGHLLWTALSGRKDDLIESRRRLRLWFTLGIAVAATLILSGETLQYTLSRGAPDPEWFTTARVAVAWPIIFFGCALFLRLIPASFLFEPVKQSPAPTPTIDPKDTAIHTRLVTAMEKDKIYKEHGLGIGTLAAKINVPEHQLRALINKGLGYRNFAGFLNAYRLSDAKAALSDPEQARTPILTLAMDAGYASLATFNRAFKASEGITPSDYRDQSLLAASQT